VKPEDYSSDHMLFYPGAGLSAEEKERLAAYDISIKELTVDHLVHSMSTQIETNFQTFYTVAEGILGVETTLKLAHEIGTRYGGAGYAKFLRAQGTEGHGSPRTMALYQDLVHAIRGPKHAAALFAEHDETRCRVKRRQCIYYNEQNPSNGKYTEAFEAGCFVGYVAADANMLRVEVVECVFQGASGCEQHWVFLPPEERVFPNGVH
jgi:hypothetical protein